MARQTFKIEGLRELEAALTELPKATAKSTLKRVLVKAAQPIKEHWEGSVPVKTGRYKQNIIVGNKPDAGKIAYGRTMRLGGTKGDATEALKAARKANPSSFAQLFIGAAKKIRQAIPLEFGTDKMAAQPSARPAWDAKQGEALDVIQDNLLSEITKSQQRLARKNARLIAKARGGI